MFQQDFYRHCFRHRNSFAMTQPATIERNIWTDPRQFKKEMTESFE